ncbi:hypothetical protein QQF64_026680 [Cirrhinus molitorella]|uniref:Uncharacterized protein n=1 Tax=Cirrhinus molitorella TaxID=172907 RepID=A0ABR3NA72_9TELE
MRDSPQQNLPCSILLLFSKSKPTTAFIRDVQKAQVKSLRRKKNELDARIEDSRPVGRKEGDWREVDRSVGWS